MIVAGIDPGSWFTGIAFIKISHHPPIIIHTQSLNLDNQLQVPEKLCQIYTFIQENIKKYSPDYCAIENPVYGKNPISMVKLARAQAAAILAVSFLGLRIIEFLPKQIKKSITGNGNSSKEQVRYIVGQIFQHKTQNISEHEIDAVSIAWCGSIYRYGIPRQQTNKAKAWEDYIIDNTDKVIK